MKSGIECAFTGRLGQDPKVRISSSGSPWLAFSVAVGSDEATTWVHVALFGELAEKLSAKLHKGDRVQVEGWLKLNTWTGDDGSARSGLQVTATAVHRVGSTGRRAPAKELA